MICGEKINTNLIYDFFRCVDFHLLKKKNGDYYINMKLSNSKGVYDSYLWDNLDIFENRIKRRSIYAVKAKTEIFNNSTVLNVKNIKQVSGDLYNRYGYSSNSIKTDKITRNTFYYSEIITIIQKYNSQPLKIIFNFYKAQMDEIIRGKSLENKLNSIKYILISKNSSFDESMIEEFISAVLIYGLTKAQLGSISLDSKSPDMINMYINDKKEFIKKYKYIVDLIALNNTN